MQLNRTARIWFLLGLISVSLSLNGVQTFLPSPALTGRKRILPLRSSNEDDLDGMRKLLETSWNSETMGIVPSNPEAAAAAAATSMRNAMDNGKSLFFVDLLLPSYDITQGPNMYDDVLAVEFCIALTNALKEKASILVRDEKSRNAVSRIIEARERDGNGQDEEEDFLDSADSDDGMDEDDDDDSVEFFDDFADFGGIGDTAGQDVDAFREQLMATWDGPTAEKETPENLKANEAVKESSSKADVSPKKAKKRWPAAPKMATAKSYRLASLFGDAKIATGSDMMDQVVKAVAANGQPLEDEKTIIILSAVTREEMIAVRSLVAKYKTNKNIVLVNCQIDPLPRELIRAITVYSILPLVAKPVVSEQNIFGSEEAQQGEAPPKVVIMRRFPRDWEVFVDADGSGFELADVAPASKVGKKGPPMEWIAGCVKRHLQSKFG